MQCAGGSSKIEVIQEALRGSRTLPKETMEALGIKEEKTHFVLIDFLDNHDERLERMALQRLEHYKKQGWKIKLVESSEEIDWTDYK
jgi:hypothetical protein